MHTHTHSDMLSFLSQIARHSVHSPSATGGGGHVGTEGFVTGSRTYRRPNSPLLGTRMDGKFIPQHSPWYVPSASRRSQDFHRTRNSTSNTSHHGKSDGRAIFWTEARPKNLILTLTQTLTLLRVSPRAYSPEACQENAQNIRLQ